MTGYIYLITNLVNGKQYVGQTIKTIKERFKNHINESKSGSDNMLIHISMRKYGIDNFDVTEIISVNADNRKELVEKLNYYEILYISKYNTLMPDGYNMTKGGNEFREYSKIKVDEYDLYGNLLNTYDSYDEAARSLNKTTNNAIRKCCLGISKFAFQRIWRLHGDPFDKYELPNVKIAERNYKFASVDQYTTDGKFIRTFESQTDINFYLGVEHANSHIAECCKKKLATAYGYVWRYHGEPFDIVNDGRNVSIEKYNKNNELIEVYTSLKDAASSIGSNITTISSNIRRCIKGGSITAYGYKWKYVS